MAPVAVSSAAATGEDAISRSIDARNTLGGTALSQVRAQIARHRACLG